jgi:hypothetical protein
MHAVANTPAEPLKHVARALQRHRPSPNFGEVGFRITLFRGLLSVHSRYGLHARQVAFVATLYIEDFVEFVASLDAPIASGWSDSCRAGLSPAGFVRLSTAYRKGSCYK